VQRSVFERTVMAAFDGRQATLAAPFTAVVDHLFAAVMPGTATSPAASSPGSAGRDEPDGERGRRYQAFRAGP
jgi:hypothetical protein